MDYNSYTQSDFQSNNFQIKSTQSLPEFCIKTFLNFIFPKSTSRPSYFELLIKMSFIDPSTCTISKAFSNLQFSMIYLVQRRSDQINLNIL